VDFFLSPKASISRIPAYIEYFSLTYVLALGRVMSDINGSTS